MAYTSLNAILGSSGQPRRKRKPAPSPPRSTRSSEAAVLRRPPPLGRATTSQPRTAAVPSSPRPASSPAGRSSPSDSRPMSHTLRARLGDERARQRAARESVRRWFDSTPAHARPQLIGGLAASPHYGAGAYLRDRANARR